MMDIDQRMRGYTFSFCFIILLFLWAPGIFAQSDSKPNIIIIIADDLGYADVGCNDGWIKTPNIDRLAAEGIRLTDFHTSGTVCSPTRAGLMTGLYQYRVGVPGVIVAFTNNQEHERGLDPTAPTFPELLKKSGYTTALFGKWHLGYSENFNPVHYGFDQFKGYVSGQIDYFSHVDLSGAFDWWNGTEKKDETGYSTHLINNHAVDFIKKNKNHPFCLVVANQAVHNPYQGPDDHAFRKPGVSSPEVPSPVRTAKESLRLMMEEMDKGVGQIMQTLDQTGLRENTLVFFLSDNGGVLHISSNEPYRGGKGMVWEGGHHVPAIVSWPGKIKAGVVSNEPCNSLDVMPTVLDLAGVSLPTDRALDGISLKNLFFRQQPVGDRQFFWHANRAYEYGVLEGNWKLIGTKKGAALLFDLSTDKGETKDISSQHPDIVKKMQEAYDAWKKDVGVEKYTIKKSDE